jgi:Tol biopolymer transport system component
MKLTSSGGPMVANARWSPDGQSLVIHSLLRGVRGIDLVSVSNGKTRRLTQGGSQTTWSRDGKWIYFGASRGGRSQVWKMPSGGGEPLQVTRQGGGGAAFESRDGKFLYYVKSGQIWKIPLGGGEEVKVIEGPLSYSMNYVLAEDGIDFVSARKPGPGTLFYYSFAAGTLRVITEIKRWHLGLAISPDRRTLLYTQMEQIDADLMLVENFR